MSKPAKYNWAQFFTPCTFFLYFRQGGNGMGRTNKYLTQVEPNLYMVEAWARAGLNNEQIAKNLSISITQFYAWMQKYPKFAEAVRGNKEIADREVENAMYKRACGYDVTEVTRERQPVLDAEGNPKYKIVRGVKVPITKMVVVKENVKHIAGDTGAEMNWLKNRKPGEWKDKKEVGVDVKGRLEDFFKEDGQE